MAVPEDFERRVICQRGGGRAALRGRRAGRAPEPDAHVDGETQVGTRTTRSTGVSARRSRCSRRPRGRLTTQLRRLHSDQQAAEHKAARVNPGSGVARLVDGSGLVDNGPPLPDGGAG